MSRPARYLVGIDLGTSHVVVAYGDLRLGPQARVELFEIDQLIAPGNVAARPLLPALRYHPAPGELPEAELRLPWSRDEALAPLIIGELARELGAKSHGRLVASAKSWLSQNAVDRGAPILPWGAPEEIPRVSPVEASASYLRHVREAWNHRHGEFPLESQEIIITVPASFDEVARTLTLEAARLAGLAKVLLVEEPQAACYDWLWQNRGTLAEQLREVKLLLVVDIGGGTTDLSLIQVAMDQGEPRLSRLAVGHHLMLGGDNIDLSLAHQAESALGGGERRLSSGELTQLIAQCRLAKERLLGAQPPAKAQVALLGAGSRLIGGTRTAELALDPVRAAVLDGFFPLVPLDASPDRRRSGVVEFGLPYAPDPAISKHLAAFLGAHHQLMANALGQSEVPVPDAVLLNGGLFNSPAITERLMEQLEHWRGLRPRHLSNSRPEQAVACGAVAYGLARRGWTLPTIGGGSARSYFLSVETGRGKTAQALCLLPRGTEEGREVVLADRNFALRLGRPVLFHLATSTADLSCQAGDLLPWDPAELEPLPPLATALETAEDFQGGEEVPVKLAACLTEVGTLRVQCLAEQLGGRRWDLEFQIRGTPAGLAPGEAAPRHARWEEAQELIRRVFGKKSRDQDPRKIKSLRADLESLLGKRDTWEIGLLRELFAALLDGLPHRRRTPEHERIWLNLTGFALRPGFGETLDEWRVTQVWPLYGQGLQYVGEAQNWAEWWTLWRRVAGGLNAEQQMIVFSDLQAFLDPDAAKRGNLSAQAKKRGFEDMLRLAASLERISVASKCKLGQWLLQRLGKSPESGELWWALGRTGARVPFHGSIHNVVPPGEAALWLKQMLALDWKNQAAAGFAATLIARMSGDRARDLDQELRDPLLAKLRGTKSPESWLAMVSEFRELEQADERRIFGEALPAGLKLLQ